jgi:hypothetical protein
MDPVYNAHCPQPQQLPPCASFSQMRLQALLLLLPPPPLLLLLLLLLLPLLLLPLQASPAGRQR